MLTEAVVLTALPAGVDLENGVARVTCFVTLRAAGDEAALETRWAVLGGPRPSRPPSTDWRSRSTASASSPREWSRRPRTPGCGPRSSGRRPR